MAATVGALRVTLGADTAQFQAGMTRAQAQARRTGQGIERSMSQMRVRTVQAFGAVRVAAAGLGVGLGVGVFVQQAREAFAFASSLTETARAIGVTVEQYQILTRAAIENGASQEGMDRAIGILNRTLGQARAGVPAAVQAFRALRIDPEQFTRAGDVIPIVMERIRNLRTESEQAAGAQRLFGRGAMELIPFLIQGAAGYDEVARAARAAGLITTEQARRADEASDRLSILAHTLRVNLASALLEVLPALEEVLRGIMRIGSGATWALQQLSGLTSQRQQQAPSTRLDRVAQRNSSLASRLLIWPSLAVSLLREAGSPPPRGGQRGPGLASAGSVGRPPLGPDELDLSPAGGGRGGGDQARQRALREAHEFQSQIRRHRMDFLRAQEGFSQDFEARYDLGRQIAAAERDQYQSDLQLSVQLHDRTEQQAALLMKGYDATDAAERQSANQELDANYASRRQALADREFELAGAALRDEADMADTAGERRRIELELLALTYRHRRAKLESIIAEQEAGRATRQAGDEARRELAQLDAARSRDEAGVRRGTRGPMEEFLAGLPTTAARANEALESIAVGGLNSIIRGLAEAGAGVTSLSGLFRSFRNIATQALADVLEMLLRREFARLLTGGSGGLGGLFGGKGGGGGLKLAGLHEAFAIPGKAAGGPVIPGRTYVVGERGPELLRMGSMAGRITPNDEIGGRTRVMIVPSPYFDVRVDGRAVAVAAPIGQAAAMIGSGAAQAALAKRARSRIP